MHIDDGDALKTWLQNKLTTVSDADPQSLSRYVLALLKKDKPASELKAFCVEQLDVFLGKETNTFVDNVFDVVTDRSYMPGVVKAPPAVVNDVKPVVKSSTRSSKDDKPRESSSSKRSSSSAVKKDESKTSDRSSTRSTTSRVASTVRDTTVKHRDDTSDTSSSRKRIAAPPAAESSSRNGKSDRSPPRSTINERTTITVHSRLGPPVRTVRTGRGSPDARPKRHSPPATRSRSRSPRRREERTVRRVTRQAIDDLSSGSGSSDEEVHTKRARRRCKDYDMKGYCMLGDACQFDHGPDPVVVKDTQALPSMIARQRGADFDSTMPPPNILPPGVDGPPGVGQAPPTTTSNVPVVAMIMQPPPNQFANFPGFPTNMSQPPPSMPQQFTQPPPPMFSSHSAGLRARLGTAPRFRAPGAPQDSKTLIISKVPPHQNNIGTLDSHFKQFGPITNIKVNYAGKHDQALITYSDRYNALQAFKSTQPILNNRFIKCFWFDGDVDAPHGGQDEGMQESGMISKTLYNRGAMRKRAPEMDRPAYKTTAAAQQQYVEERKARKEHHAKRVLVNDVFKAQVKIAEDSVKQQKEIMAKMETCQDSAMMKEMTKIFKLLEASGKAASKEAARLKEQMQTLDETKPTIGDENSNEWRRKRALEVRAEQQNLKEKIRKTSLSASQETEENAGSPVKVVKVDSESTELMKRMAQLKKELITLGSTRGGHSPRGRGGRGGGRGGRRVPPSIQQLDKRPTTLVITKFESNEKNELTSHLEQFGTVSSCEFEMKAGELRAVAKYSSRKAAEQAHELASDFKDRTITVDWAPIRTPRASLSENKHDTPEKISGAVRRESASQLLANLNQDDDLSDGGEEYGDAFDGENKIEVKEEELDV